MSDIYIQKISPPLSFILSFVLLIIYSAGINAGSGESVVFSASANRSNPLQNLSNATVSGSIYPFVQIESKVRQVRFLIDNIEINTDKSAPYDVAGGSAELANPLDTTELANGFHTLTAVFYYRRGQGIVVRNTPFTVDNGLPSEPVPVGILTPSPKSVHFSEQTVDTESPSRRISFTNSGKASVTIQGVTISGDYKKVSDNCSELAVGNSCDIRVTFLPTTAGIRSGELKLSSNAENNPVTVALTGSGVLISEPIGILTPSLGSVNFGEQPVDTESPSRGISFTNSGDASVTIQGVAITGDYKKVSDNCSELAVGNSCIISVTFLPTAEGIRSGKLTLSSNAQNNPVSVTLTGSGASLTVVNTHLWVDASNGADTNSGLTVNAAFRTIQKAAVVAQSGDMVHIMPGVYREDVTPSSSGTATAPIRYVAEAGPGTVILRGSISSSSQSWNQLSNNTIGLPAGVPPSNIYYTDLSALRLNKAPRYIVELDENGEPAQRLPLAREPDWSVETEWKNHEFWWTADGGSTIPSCDPLTDNDNNCDLSSRSDTQMIDRNDDLQPVGVESGNLTSMGNLTGSTLVVMDSISGVGLYRSRIVTHNVESGKITVDEAVGRPGKPGLGWGSKYYVENLPKLLDNPGEWWYDSASGRLYLWPSTAGNPGTMNIEISRFEQGFDLTNRSYVELDGITVEFYEGNAVAVQNHGFHESHGVALRNVTLRYADTGIFLKHHVLPEESPSKKIDGFVVEDSEIAFMDSMAIEIDYTWKGNFVHPGVDNTVIRRNELHHLGFHYGKVGARFAYADHLRFEDNHVHHVSLSGILFLRSIVDSPKTYGFSANEIKTGNILIRGNLFEKICQNQCDCAALKIAGSPPSMHVFRDLLVTGNIFRDNVGWSSIAEKRGRFIKGKGARGLYVDNASGVHAYQNIAYNNSFAGFSGVLVWRDGDIVFYNNIIANSLHGLFFSGRDKDTHINVNTQIANNIILNNERGLLLEDGDGNYENTVINHNLYYNNGWNTIAEGGLWNAGDFVLDTGSYSTLKDIQAGTDFESNGQAGDPYFWNYDENDHEFDDGSWPDFNLTSSSPNVLDRSVNLPNSLLDLLEYFEVENQSLEYMFDTGEL